MRICRAHGVEATRVQSPLLRRPPPTSLSGRAPRLPRLPRTVGPGGGGDPASRPGRRVGLCNTSHANFCPANCLRSRVHRATPTAPSVLPSAPTLSPQRRLPACPARGTSFAAAAPVSPSRPSNLRARRGLTCWEQTGTGWSRSRGEARTEASSLRSRGSSSRPSRGPRTTGGPRRGVPMAPHCRGRLAARGGGAARCRPWALPSAEKLRVSSSSPASGFQRSRGRAAEGPGSGATGASLGPPPAVRPGARSSPRSRGRRSAHRHWRPAAPPPPPPLLAFGSRQLANFNSVPTRPPGCWALVLSRVARPPRQPFLSFLLCLWTSAPSSRLQGSAIS